MRFCRTIYLITAWIFLLAGPAHAGKEQFDTDKMLSELETQLELSSDKLSKLKPALDAKSAELKKSIDESVEKGFMELGALTDQLDAASKEAEAQLREALNSQEMQQLKDFLNSIDKQAIEEIRDELVAQLTEFLKLTEAQLKELRPALEDAFDRLGEMLGELAREGGKNLEEFKKRYEQLNEELKKKMAESLDGEQIKLLDEHRDDLNNNIRQALFST